MNAARKHSLRRATLILIAAWLISLPVQAKYGGGVGTAEEPYQIRTAEQMNAIGIEPNDWDKHFKLMADIDLGQYTANEFNIIGVFDTATHKPFAGVFDGNGHTISHFTWDSDVRSSMGLFGFVASPLGYLGHWDDLHPEIRNLGLLSPRVNAGAGFQVGSLVGCLSQARVINCYARDAVVSGGSEVGGLIGEVESGTVAACYATGTVTGGNSTGGLAGFNRGCVINCYSQTNTRGNEGVGGLVGYNMDEGTIVNCYACGTASGTYGVGGLAGYDWGAVVGSYWDAQVGGPIEGPGGSGKSTAEMCAVSTFVGWTPGQGERMWTIDEGKDYPRLYWEDRPGRDLTGAQLGDLLAGDGTSDSPFLIRSGDELDLIGRFPYDWSKRFKLTADIDLSKYTGDTFHIIGAFRLPFTGSFDGDNHTISGFHYAVASGSYRGLFGCISHPNAEVRNLVLVAPSTATEGGHLGVLAGALEYGTVKGCRVKDAVVTGGNNVSGLVAYNYKGIIRDCHVAGTIIGTVNGVQGFAGGLTAYNDGVLRNCSSVGAVTGGTFVGGLTGWNANFASMANCRSTCSVTGEAEVGGLAGRNTYYSTIADCYCTGSVAGVTGVGGLVGCNEGNSTVLNCYAAGLVTGQENVGGLVGQGGYGPATVKASYWDVAATGQPASAGGKDLTTVEMQLARTFLNAGWDFMIETTNGTEDIWWIEEEKDYPRLWWEAADPNSSP
jgi:hypothetical protein